MKKELVNLSEYKLNLGSALVDNKLFGLAFDRTIMDLYYEFNQEYKNIAESRYNHSSKASASGGHIAGVGMSEPFWEKDEYMVNLCNIKFEFLVECGVFAKK